TAHAPLLPPLDLNSESLMPFVQQSPTDPRNLDPEERARVRVKLDKAERVAREILAFHQPLLKSMAAALVQAREFGAAEVADWLKDLAPPSCGYSDT
ncbi:hypothetical protein, partial [Tritonibacter sp. SIMBA_163]|uniref:hypothetical protein n=1 Tax=Tritonibacter sp. SIMBA_163 TaxID=3080868 RepID=UPI00397F7888